MSASTQPDLSSSTLDRNGPTNGVPGGQSPVLKNRVAEQPSTTTQALMGLIICLAITLVTLLCIATRPFPQAAKADAPLADFSAERALADLRHIAAAPHALGTREHTRVADFIEDRIRALGVQPQIHKGELMRRTRAGAIQMYAVRNIMTRIPGTGSTGAVLLSAHYDTVPSSPGAADDGAAVAALLETLRVVRASPTLKNDVIFLFSDDEEDASVGAKVFFDEHPWAKEVTVAFNFEARGSGGPAVMFETGNQSGWIVEQFLKKAKYPWVNSLAPSMYAKLAFTTDFTIFKKAGIQGLNFAFVENWRNFHSVLDSIDHLDPRSLQHHGSSMVALVSEFGSIDLTRIPKKSSVYFNILGSFAVIYTAAWIPILTLLAAGGLITVLVLGVRKEKLAWGRLLLGMLALLSATIAAVLVALGLGEVIEEFANLALFYHGNAVQIAIIAMAVGGALCVWRLFDKKLNVENTLAGNLLWWLTGLVATTILLPGATHLFLWPLVGGTLLLLWMLSSKAQKASRVANAVVMILCALPVVVVVAPVEQLLLLAFLSAAPVVVTIILTLGLLKAQWQWAMQRRWWLAPAVLAACSIGFLLAAEFLAKYDVQRPATDSVMYLLDAPSNKAVWISPDRKPDVWTAQFFHQGQCQDLPAGYVPTWYPVVPRKCILTSQAPTVSLPGPALSVVSDQTSNDVRTIRMHVSSERGAPQLAVHVPADVSSMMVDGKQVDLSVKGPLTGTLLYSGLSAAGIEIVVQIPPNKPVNIDVVDRSLTLPPPEGKWNIRPNTMIAAPFPGDATIVTKSYKL